MTEAAKMVTRGWADMLIGAILLAGALLALWLPVYLWLCMTPRCWIAGIDRTGRVPSDTTL